MYSQYKEDLFRKLDFKFESGKSLLDVGCGDGTDATIFSEKYGLNVSGMDVYKHDRIEELSYLNFKIGSALEIPFPDKSFDYVFLHDVLHHIDEDRQDREVHIPVLKELGRVLKDNGFIVIVEGNRYNPLFYPHLVLLENHQHFTQKYFINIIKDVYPNTSFKFFECHYYPKKLKFIWKIYDFLMDRFAPRSILSYNVAIINKGIGK